MTLARLKVPPLSETSAVELGAAAAACLMLELATYPKPGLVSHVDNGAHGDMTAATLLRSAAVLEPFFCELACAGAAGAGMSTLRAIGIDAERAMLDATGGVNTHRGAIFGLGLLVAAAGVRETRGGRGQFGEIVAHRWADDIRSGPPSLRSHGAEVARRHGAGGARAEAAAGFPSVYEVALPALRLGRRLAQDEEAARVQACMALIAVVEDTNLLFRGGAHGLAFGRDLAAKFLADGGVGTADWRERAIVVHRAFVRRRLSPGGSADLLAMALFIDRMER